LANNRYILDAVRKPALVTAWTTSARGGKHPFALDAAGLDGPVTALISTGVTEHAAAGGGCGRLRSGRSGDGRSGGGQSRGGDEGEDGGCVLHFELKGMLLLLFLLCVRYGRIGEIVMLKIWADDIVRIVRGGCEQKGTDGILYFFFLSFCFKFGSRYIRSMFGIAVYLVQAPAFILVVLK
jgi:hypothetical protein